MLRFIEPVSLLSVCLCRHIFSADWTNIQRKLCLLCRCSLIGSDLTEHIKTSGGRSSCAYWADRPWLICGAPKWLLHAVTSWFSSSRWTSEHKQTETVEGNTKPWTVNNPRVNDFNVRFSLRAHFHVHRLLGFIATSLCCCGFVMWNG